MSQENTQEECVKIDLAQRWEELTLKRNDTLKMARECAALTIPALLPPEGKKGGVELRQPCHSIGARAINNIAAKLLLALFPPNLPSFKLSVEESKLQDIQTLTEEVSKMEQGDAPPQKKNEGIRLAIDNKLKSFQKIMAQNIEFMAARPKLFLAFKYLVACGNTLLYMPDKKTVKVYKLDSYCITRDHVGNVLEIIVREIKAFGTLTPELQTAVQDSDKQGNSANKQYELADEVTLYTQVLRKNDDTWEARQEIEGVEIEKAKGTYTEKGTPNPWLVLRWSAISDEDYGRGLVEEYLGDLRSVNGTQKAFNDYLAVAAKIIGLVNPSASAGLAGKLSQAKSGDFVKGKKDDISFLELNKYFDFKTAMAMMEKKERNLEQGFLLNSSVQRDGERVTAEEIRTVASDLEDHLGGVYSVLAQELQMPFIQLIMHYSKKDLPIDLNGINPTVTTGLDALGRGQDLRKLADFMKTLGLLPPEMAWQLINPLELIQRLASALGVDPDNLIKTIEEIQQEREAAAQAQQQATQQDAVMKGMSGAIPHVVKSIGENPEALGQIQEAIQP